MKCPSCQEEYKKLSTHWSKSDCSYPDFTQKEMDILTGILMGDGTICDKNDSKRNPRFRLTITNRDYLEDIKNKLNSLLVKDIRVHRTAEQISKQDMSYNKSFSNSSNPNDYKTQYHIQTISHPKLSKFSKWYNTGEKKFPKMDINSTILKHWYVCDGS
jgi:hypothetical protein